MIKNFLNITDLSNDNILSIINDNKHVKVLQNKSIGLLFEKNSTRTRLSFAVGISDLGGNAVNIKFEDLNISRDESFEDTFRAMDCYLDGLVYRTNNHQNLIHASRYFKKPIINALSDQSHPCQTLSDLVSLKEHFGSLDVHILWMGDMNNVCFSLVEAVNLIQELKLTICTPSSISKMTNWVFGSNISIIHDLKNIDLQSINCVMTDVFISMNDKESDKKIKSLKPYAVNSNLMSKTDTNSIFMHCLPAKIGFEVSEEVFKSPKSIVWRQAFNRLVAQRRLLQFIYQ
jgi:ornithine carbamoyltransferase